MINRSDVTDFLTNPLRSDYPTDLTTITNRYFVNDSWKIPDALTIAGGFMSARVANDIATTFGTPFINDKIATKDWFQPQVGATYRLGRQEFFANYAKNMRAYISSFRGPFGTTQVGVEIGATYRVARRLSLIASYSYNDNIYDDDTVNGTAFVPTKGVHIVDTRAHLPRGEINCDDGMFFGNVAGTFTSRRNVTDTGDVSVNGYTLLYAAVDYRFPANSALAGVEIQVNAVNPTDASLVASTAVTQFQTLNRNLRLRTPDIR